MAPMAEATTRQKRPHDRNANPMTARHGSRLTILLVCLVIAMLADLLTGSVRIPLREIFAALAGGETSQAGWHDIVWRLRVPKVLTAACAGAALATSGLLMQTLFRNPLAGPFILGISSGASLGVALVVLSLGAGTSSLLAGLGIGGDLALVVAASLGSAVALSGVLFAARRVSVLTLLILGMLFGYAASALVTILMHFSLAEEIQAYVRWTFGSFGGVSLEQMRLLLPPLVLGLGLAWATAKPLNALLLGEATARSLGVAVKPARTLILLATALLAGSVTAFCGPVGFIGVAVPHLARALFVTSDHRLLIPATALLGAICGLVADTVAQLPGSQLALPLNAVTALLGAPIIAFVVLRRRTMEASFGD